MDDKWGRRLFTAGAVMLLLLGAVHSLSLMEKPVPANETEKQLLDLMTNYHFNLMGSLRSMNDLLRGFSVSFMAGAIAIGALGLSLRRMSAAVLKRVALVNTIWLAAMTGVSLRYFFCRTYGVLSGRSADIRSGLDKDSTPGRHCSVGGFCGGYGVKCARPGKPKTQIPN